MFNIMFLKFLLKYCKHEKNQWDDEEVILPEVLNTNHEDFWDDFPRLISYFFEEAYNNSEFMGNRAFPVSYIEEKLKGEIDDFNKEIGRRIKNRN